MPPHVTNMLIIHLLGFDMTPLLFFIKPFSVYFSSFMLFLNASVCVCVYHIQTKFQHQICHLLTILI